MKKEITRIYVKLSPDKKEIIYSGIKFSEFICYLSQRIENLMLITGGNNIILGETKLERGLELFEGQGLIQRLTQQDIYNLGNFCFVDYLSSGSTSNLTEEQIAELLYLGHMFKPLRSPFFEVLQNRFAYLSHDDGWYCKLYCQEPLDFIKILCCKIRKSLGDKSIEPMPQDIVKSIYQMSISGVLIDLDEVHRSSVNLYKVGDYSEIDTLLNTYQHAKFNASQVVTLRLSKNCWSLN